LGAEPVFTADAARIRLAERVILPGVGAAGAAMEHLRNAGLQDCIRQLQQPVLGVCLGMQLMFEQSEEDDTDCLGIIPGTIRKLQASEGVRVPHMGWNTTETVTDDPLLNDLPQQPWFYFVHSYVAPVGAATLATCRHSESFAAMVRSGNFRGVQFHPERSSKVGARLLENFLSCN
jgi:glutamine amidotransferase